VPPGQVRGGARRIHQVGRGVAPPLLVLGTSAPGTSDERYRRPRSVRSAPPRAPPVLGLWCPKPGPATQVRMGRSMDARPAHAAMSLPPHGGPNAWLTARPPHHRVRAGAAEIGRAHV